MPIDVRHAWRIRVFKRSSRTSWDLLSKKIVRTKSNTLEKGIVYTFPESGVEHLTHGSPMALGLLHEQPMTLKAAAGSIRCIDVVMNMAKAAKVR